MDRWISVEDRLPEPGVEVLTKMKHGLISGFHDYERTDMAVFHGYYWRDMEWFATHWMPLPPAPEGKQ